MASCNLNDQVKFRLTNLGKKVLTKYLQEQREKYGIDAHECYKTDCAGDMRIPLHDFMLVFGPAMGIGFDNQVIEKNELTFCGC
jgi:hypothetical protein